MLVWLVTAAPALAENATVVAVGMSADGRTAYSVEARSATLGIWDTTTGSLVERVALPPGRPSRIDVAENGYVLIAQGNTSWLMAPDRSMAPVDALFSTLDRTGTRLVRLSGHRELTVTDPATGSLVRTLPLPGAATFSVDLDLTPDGRFVVVAAAELGDPLLVHVLDLEGGVTLRTFKGLKDVNRLEISPDGSRVAVGFRDGRDWSSPVVLDVATGKRLYSLPRAETVNESYSDFEFTQDGHHLVVARNQALEIWDATAVAPKGPAKAYRGDSASGHWTAIAGSADATRLVAGTYGDTERAAVGIVRDQQLFVGPFP